MLRKRNQLLAVFCILTLLLPGCSRKQVFVSAPQEGKNPYRKSSPKSFSDQIRSVFKVSEINRWAREQVDKDTLLDRYPELAPTLAQVERDPSDLGAKRRLADFYAEKRLYRRALEHYSELAVMLPGDEQIQLALGRIWDHQGAYAIALRHAINAVELNPESIPAKILLGTVYLHRDEPENASKAFLSVLEKDPENGGVLANAGYAYLKLKQWQTACGYLEAALQIDPDSDKVRNNLGIAKAYLGDEEGAMQEFLKVSQPAVAYNNLGAAYLAQEEWSKARNAFENALAWDPAYVKARLNLMEAESYLPPPSVVDLARFNTRLAWLGSSWEKHVGVSNQGIFNLPQMRLPESSEYLRFPLRNLDLPITSPGQDILATVPFSQAAKQAPTRSGFPGVNESTDPNSVVTEQTADESVSLTSLDPVLFTVRDSEESQPPASLPTIQGKTLPEAQMPPPAKMVEWEQLLSRAIELPAGTLRSVQPAKENQNIPEPLALAGGDILNLLVKRPNLDWNGLEQFPEARRQEAPTQVSEPQRTPYPAQVWLPLRGGKATGIAQREFQAGAVPETVLKLAALEPVAFPFQLSGVLMKDPKPIDTRPITLPSKTQETVREDAMSTQLSQTVSARIEEPDVVVSELEPETVTRPENAQHQLLLFDQFSAVREQVLKTPEDYSEQTSEVAPAAPAMPSGLAGLAGLALILVSLGSSRLYVRWRSPFRKSNTLSLD